MAGPTTRARANWAVDRATSLAEVWAIVAKHLGLVGAWQLMLVCRAACAGAKEFLATLPRLVVCGGRTGGGGLVSDVRRMNLATLRWEMMPSLLLARKNHACCTVRSALVVLGGDMSSSGDDEFTSSVEMLSKGKEATRLPDGSVVCAGGLDGNDETSSSVEILEPPVQGATDAAWTKRELPALSVERFGCSGCVLSDGRFAVLGGENSNGQILSSVEAMTVGDGEHWEHLPPMHDARAFCACAAVAGCIIVAGGSGLKSAEVFDEVLDRWLRLPCDLPLDDELYDMGSALL